jgi:hypothetical protein
LGSHGKDRDYKHNKQNKREVKTRGAIARPEQEIDHPE